MSFIVHTRAGYHFKYFDIDVSTITEIRYNFNIKIIFYHLILKNINMFLKYFTVALDQFSQQIVSVQNII